MRKVIAIVLFWAAWLVAAPFLLLACAIAALPKLAAWADLHANYAGDAEARDRDRWKAT